MSELKYRPDVDGLRAIAILSVVMFHAGVQLFSGGFSGVDIFFVISGFLITSIIAKEIRQGDFSIIAFYERRIRRILPAFFTVIIFSSIAAFVLFLPRDLNGYGKSLVAAALSVSNFLFWRESGYFDSLAELKPLLHTWSLGVEAQFYIFFPIFLLAISRFSKKRWMVWILLGALVSFLASIWGAKHHSLAAFYLAPTRAWELAIGSLLALGVIPAVHIWYFREIVAFVGAALIILGIVTLTPDSVFPGINALLPCMGAALIIYSGSSGSTLIGHILGWRPFVLIGLISYSLYLWHWPLLVFTRYYAVRPLTNSEMLEVLLVAFMLAIATWHFVERPFLGKKRIFTRTGIFSGSGILTASAVMFGLIIILANGWPIRISGEALALANGASDISASSRSCMEKNNTMQGTCGYCIIGAIDGAPSFVVMGDSHASALMPGIEMAAKMYGAKGIHAAMQSCPPLVGVINRKDEIGQRCVTFRNKMLTLIEEAPYIQKVLLIARWPAYAEGSRYGRDDAGPKPMLIDEVSQLSDSHAVFLMGIERTVERLRKANKQVIIVFSVPEIGRNVPSVSARNVLFGHNIDIRPKIADFLKRNEFVLSAINGVAARHGARLIYPHSALCANDYCSTTINGRSLYFDDDHLSVFGSERISYIFKPVFGEQL